MTDRSTPRAGGYKDEPARLTNDVLERPEPTWGHVLKAVVAGHAKLLISGMLSLGLVVAMVVGGGQFVVMEAVRQHMLLTGACAGGGAGLSAALLGRRRIGTSGRAMMTRVRRRRANTDERP